MVSIAVEVELGAQRFHATRQQIKHLSEEHSSTKTYKLTDRIFVIFCARNVRDNIGVFWGYQKVVRSTFEIGRK